MKTSQEDLPLKQRNNKLRKYVTEARIELTRANLQLLGGIAVALSGDYVVEHAAQPANFVLGMPTMGIGAVMAVNGFFRTHDAFVRPLPEPPETIE